MKPSLVPIVEGHAEQASVPVLLRRILASEHFYEVSIARPFRVKRYSVVRPGELERAVKQAVRSRENAAAILVILDADDDCPATCRSSTHLPAAVVLAQREFEAWLLGAKEALRGVRGIRQDATAPSHPEAIRGAKERVSQNMQGRRYVPVDDQAALAERMDIRLAADREVRRLLCHIHRSP